MNPIHLHIKHTYILRYITHIVHRHIKFIQQSYVEKSSELQQHTPIKLTLEQKSCLKNEKYFFQNIRN